MRVGVCQAQEVSAVEVLPDVERLLVDVHVGILKHTELDKAAQPGTNLLEVAEQSGLARPHVALHSDGVGTTLSAVSVWMFCRYLPDALWRSSSAVGKGM